MTEGEKGKKLDQGDFNNVIKKVNDKIKQEDVEEINEAFKSTKNGGIKGEDLLEALKNVYYENN